MHLRPARIRPCMAHSIVQMDQNLVKLIAEGGNSYFVCRYRCRGRKELDALYQCAPAMNRKSGVEFVKRSVRYDSSTLLGGKVPGRRKMSHTSRQLLGSCPGQMCRKEIANFIDQRRSSAPSLPPPQRATSNLPHPEQPGMLLPRSTPFFFPNYPGHQQCQHPTERRSEGASSLAPPLEHRQSSK